MIEVYRLEDGFGNGPFFYRDGQTKSKTLGEWRSADKGLCSFINPARFTEPSYVCFLNSDDYILYKLTLSNYIYRSMRGEVIFLEEHICNISICDKVICRL